MKSNFAVFRRELIQTLGGFLDPEESEAEARCWFEEGLGLDRAWLAAHRDDVVPDEIIGRVAAWMERRRTGEPWAYILGWKEFRGLRFQVNPAVLIPRPETELVLEAALACGRAWGVARACDIGTGSGILGICLALETDWDILATDLSRQALAVAQGNAETLGAKLAFAEGDLLAPVPDPLGLVVSNPPYVDPADRAGLQRELGFEPQSALFAPEQGLALATELLRQARVRQAAGCVIEIGSGQGPTLVERARDLGWARAECRPDWAGHDRIVIVH
jgi:release factor glutamine methyltransferase